MKAYLEPILALVWKDILLELRTKDIVVSVLVFSLLVIVVFNFAIEPSPANVGIVAPGVLWISYIFGGVLGLTRSFGLERDSGNLRGLMLSPVSRDSIFFGKMLANFLFMMLVELMLFPVFAVLFNLPLWQPELFPIALLATLGISTIGTVFSAMAVSTRAREVMLPLLFLPAAVPIIIAAVETTGLVLREQELTDLSAWLPLMAAFDAVFLVVCPVAFHFVVED
jgi:heme exporter protein B